MSRVRVRQSVCAAMLGATFAHPALAECGIPANGSINTLQVGLTHASAVTQLPGGFFRFEHCVDNFGARAQWIDWEGTALRETFVAARSAASVFFTTMQPEYRMSATELWHGVERDVVTVPLAVRPDDPVPPGSGEAETRRAGTPPGSLADFHDPERLAALLDTLPGKQTSFGTGVQFFLPFNASVGIDPETEDPLPVAETDLLPMSVFLAQDIYLVEGTITTAFEFNVYADETAAAAFAARAGTLKVAIEGGSDFLPRVLPELAGPVAVDGDVLTLRSVDDLPLTYAREPQVIRLEISVNDGLFRTTVPFTVVY